MFISNFLKDIKIGFLDHKAQRLLEESANTLQSESLAVTLNHLSDGDTDRANNFLSETVPSLDTLVDLKEKYVRLGEKFKHDTDELLRLAIDWKDFNEMLNKLLTHKEEADAMYFQTRSREIIARFNKLLLK